ncbi:MAG: glycosyltransferase family 4 protein [Phycisphaeraceae bacterium]
MRLSNRPTVLHVRVLADHGGGPDKTILRSMSYLKAAGYRAAAAYIHPPEHDGILTILGHARTAKASVFPIPDRGALDVSTTFRLAQLCHDLSVKIWHAHDYKSEAIGLMIKSVLPMRLVSTLHGYVHADRKAQLYYEIGRQCLRGYDHVLAVSPDLVEPARRAGVAPDRITYVPNAIELDRFTRTRTTEQAKADLGIPKNRMVLGTVARLSGEKRIDRSITLLAELQQAGHDAELRIIGDGPERQPLEEHARALGVGGVIFQGWSTHPAKQMEAMDLLLLPSDKEGLPNALLEAMALGVPVAATPVGGVPDLLDQGNAGILLTAPPSEWPQQLSFLLTNPEARIALANTARQRIENHFTFDHRMRNVIDIYDELLDRRQAHAA